MSFKVVSGRPVGTESTDMGVVHYTCNPPNVEILEEKGIKLIGASFGIDPREVLLIPDSLFDEKMIPKDTLGAENILRKLSRK